jgi:hypothetical protein
VRAFKRFRDLLALAEIDAIDVCLHNNLHAPVTIAALRAGKHVYCEKPMAGAFADAKAMYDAYVKQQRAKGETRETNPSLIPWREVPAAQKESSRAQAAHIGVKLAAVGCSLGPLTDWEADKFTFRDEEVELLSRMEHDRWVDERKKAGWTLGLKDPDKKTTPVLVPWEELDQEAKDLDRLFVHGLPKFLAKAGFQIVRISKPGDGEPVEG